MLRPASSLQPFLKIHSSKDVYCETRPFQQLFAHFLLGDPVAVAVQWQWQSGSGRGRRVAAAATCSEQLALPSYEIHHVRCPHGTHPVNFSRTKFNSGIVLAPSLFLLQTQLEIQVFEMTNTVLVKREIM